MYSFINTKVGLLTKSILPVPNTIDLTNSVLPAPKLPDNKILVGCYHPSPRNVNTKRINVNKMVKLFNNVKSMIK